MITYLRIIVPSALFVMFMVFIFITTTTYTESKLEAAWSLKVEGYKYTYNSVDSIIFNIDYWLDDDRLTLQEAVDYICPGHKTLCSKSSIPTFFRLGYPHAVYKAFGKQLEAEMKDRYIELMNIRASKLSKEQISYAVANYSTKNR